MFRREDTCTALGLSLTTKRSQSLAAYVACTKCVQVKLAQLCIQVAQKCARVLRCTFLCNSYAHSMKLTNSSIPMYNTQPLHKNVQRRTVAHAQNVHGTCTNVHGTCTQTCTVLYQATYADFLAFYILERFKVCRRCCRRRRPSVCTY